MYICLTLCVHVYVYAYAWCMVYMYVRMKVCMYVCIPCVWCVCAFCVCMCVCRWLLMSGCWGGGAGMCVWAPQCTTTSVYVCVCAYACSMYVGML